MLIRHERQNKFKKNNTKEGENTIMVDMMFIILIRSTIGFLPFL